MNQDVSSRGSGPVDCQAIISANPLGTDVGVHLDRVRFPVGRSRRQGEVRKGKWLFDEIVRLNSHVRVNIYPDCRFGDFTSTGLRKLTVRSTGPASMTNVLCVDVNWGKLSSYRRTRSQLILQRSSSVPLSGYRFREHSVLRESCKMFRLRWCNRPILRSMEYPLIRPCMHTSYVTHRTSPESRPVGIQRCSTALVQPCWQIRRTNCQRYRCWIEWKLFQIINAQKQRTSKVENLQHGCHIFSRLGQVVLST